MSGFVQKLFAVLALLAGAESLGAFSLLGPQPPWQTTQLNYQPDAPGPFSSVGAGGVMNIHEEYRWNVPVLYYGFTAEFLTYFGQKGVEAIEEAVAIMNALPSMETVNLDDYQTESARVNLRAQALGLTDVKSLALSTILQARGLANPTRYVFTLRNRYVIENIPYYHVVKRNFDPVTLRPSSYINGTLWTYDGIIEGDGWTVINRFPVDPLERFFPRTLPVVGEDALPDGVYWTQLTRDDVGGLKHIYRTSNFNPENSIPGVSAGAAAAVVDSTTEGGQTGGFPGTDGIFDFPGSNAGGSGNGLFDFPFVIGTPDSAGPLAPPATRGGIDRILMVRSNYDALLGVYFEPLSYRYRETVLTNNNIGSRALTRTVTQPDFIFDARDMQGGDGTEAWVGFEVDTSWSNSDALLDGNSGDDFGPGVFLPPFRLTFNTAGEAYLNSQNPFFENDSEETATRLITWGWFDGSTNDPVVFPVGASILDLEERVGRGR